MSTLEIKKYVNHYKNYKIYISVISKDLFEHHSFYGFSKLRNIAKIKAENPLKFKIACFLNKIF